jgi:hypothetical protein
MFIKYPRTPHLEGSKLQPGDTDLDQVSLSSLTQGELIWEEKVDGANCAISFEDAHTCILQSRGHVLQGGHREGQFNLLKQWASAWHDDLYCVLEDRYIMYGEWCYAKHTVWYDQLPHYFLEFDVYDKQDHVWLDTETRHQLLKPLPVHHVPIIHVGHVKNRAHMQQLITRSLFKSENWKQNLKLQIQKHDQPEHMIWQQTDLSDLSEGLYVKQEWAGQTIGRFKFVRPDFVQAILDSGSHWHSRPILPNLLAPGQHIFGDSHAQAI